MTLIVHRFNTMPRHSRRGIFYFRNIGEAQAFASRYGLPKDAIVHTRNGYIVRKS